MEARGLAALLCDAGFTVVTAMAGVTSTPVIPAGEVRFGGFGGATGLADYLKDGGFTAMVDASHPFATQISGNAALAAQAAAIYCLRLERRPWQATHRDQWIEVADIAAAIAVLPGGARPLVTIGRKEIAGFFARQDICGVARMIEPPLELVPLSWHLLLARPPFSEDDEGRLMETFGITHVVAKNSGGEETLGKLIAARERKIPVVMVQRPAKPAMQTLVSAQAVAEELRRVLSA